MSTSLRVLVIEDNENFASRLASLLRHGGYEPILERVDTMEAMSAALDRQAVDLILSDYSLPRFSGLEALRLAKQRGLDVPVILLSCSIGEVAAVDAMKAGANDYVLKSNLTRLLPSIERELRETQKRRERQKAEQIVRASQNYGRAVIDSSLDMIIAVDLERHITQFNRAAQEIFGYGEQEVLGRHIDLLYADPQESLETHRAVLRVGRCVREVLNRRKSGEVFPSLLSASVVRDSRREVMGYMGISRDLTERKRAEAQLQNYESVYRSLVENLPQMIIRKDRTCRFTFANKRFCASLGVPFEAILGKTDSDFYPSHLAEKYQQDDRQVMETGQPLELVEENHLPQGEKLFVQVIKTPLRDAQGQIVGVQGIFWDITQRRRTEEQLHAQARLIDLVPDAIIVCDLEQRILYLNSGAARMHGWTATELIGRNVTELACGDAAPFAYAMAEVLREGEWRGELRQTTRDKRELVTNCCWSLICDEQGHPHSVLSISTDMTERKKLEAQLLRTQRLEGVGTLASGIAHDLNNILAPILMSAQLVRTHPLDKETDDVLAIIENAAQRGAQVVKQLSLFARGGNGDRVPLQLKHLIREVAKMMEQTLPKSITVERKVAHELWPVNGDATQLNQVLLNLCVNARDAMTTGGHLEITAENVEVDESYASMIVEGKAGPHVRLEVTDTGTGIDPALLDKIFDPFFTTKDLDKGTGLGLSTVLGIVRSHNGFISVASEVGKGSKFSVFLPAAPNASVTRTDIEDAVPSQGHGELVLVVDDEEAICGVAARMLQKHGYTALTAGDGAEAVAVFTQHRSEVKVVLTDLMMPHMGGVALVHVLRKLDPAVKILASSGLSSGLGQSINTLELKDLGVETVLVKPYTAEKLLLTIHNVLHDRKRIGMAE